MSQHDTDTALQQVFVQLTDPSVYNKNVRPFPGGSDGPINVYTRAFVYYIGDIDAQNSVSSQSIYLHSSEKLPYH